MRYWSTTNKNTSKKITLLPWFVVQWHITAHCDQKCKHCYVMNNKEMYKKEISKEISIENCWEVVNSLIDFCEVAKAKPMIVFTGGDPILRKDFFEILEYARDKKVAVKIMGNPYTLTPTIIDKLKNLGVLSYQLSLDGMQEMHDHFRKRGSFQATIEALKLLKSKSMRTVVMFTISKENASELLDVMTLVSNLKIDVFAFARFSDNNPTKNNKIENFTPSEYKDFLVKVQKHIEFLKKDNPNTYFNLKDHLWKLLLYEQGKITLEDNPGLQVISGCHVGRSGLSILAEGTVFACRRFYSPIGKVPDQSLLEIFVSSDLDHYRQIEKLEKCSNCPLLYHCRGCPSVAYASSGGNFYAPDPQCWR